MEVFWTKDLCGQLASCSVDMLQCQSSFPPTPQWSITVIIIKGLGISSHVCATVRNKRSRALIEKSRALCPGGRFPSSFIHQVIIVAGLNKLYDCIHVLALKMALDAYKA